MNEVVVFKIGGQEHKLVPLSIWSLQRCWASITSLSQVIPDMFERTEVYANIVAAGISATKETSTEDILRRMQFEEAQELPTKIAELLKISGFKPSEEVASGEDKAAIHSTETGQGSSPNLSHTE